MDYTEVVQLPGYICTGIYKYGVNRLGEVWNITTNTKRKLQLSVWGYLYVELAGGKRHRVNRLIALVFCPNPHNLPQVNHIDEVKTNNFYTNLEWCTNSHNMAHSFAKHYRLVSPTGIVTNIFNLTKFCRDNKLNHGNIFSLMNGVGKSCKGWTRYGN